MTAGSIFLRDALHLPLEYGASIDGGIDFVIVYQTKVSPQKVREQEISLHLFGPEPVQNHDWQKACAPSSGRTLNSVVGLGHATSSDEDGRPRASASPIKNRVPTLVTSKRKPGQIFPLAK